MHTLSSQLFQRNSNGTQLRRSFLEDVPDHHHPWGSQFCGHSQSSDGIHILCSIPGGQISKRKTMITVFISSHGKLTESRQLFDELSSNIASTCASAHSDDDHVSVGDAADSLPLMDSKQIYIPAGRREVCVSIKLHNGTSLSEGSPDEWMDTDIVVFLVDLSDRYCSLHPLPWPLCSPLCPDAGKASMSSRSSTPS